MDLFSKEDFQVFAIPEFAGRMKAIRARIQPRLASIGGALAPQLSSLVDVPMVVHVAKHMRRTVNPPDDTWAAFGRDRRGYKKDVHFRVSVSGQCVRFLFEAGPEYYAKAEWVRDFHRRIPAIAHDLRSAEELGWFPDEHADLPKVFLKTLSPAEMKQLGRELTRRKDGQFVLGRSIATRDCLKLTVAQFERLAVSAFASLAPLFEIHKPRVLVSQANGKVH